MSNIELQPNTSNLQTLENELSLTKQELEAFRKLPQEEQEKQKQEKLAKLSDLQNKLDQAIQEAIKTGKLDEAKKLKEQLEQEVQDLEQQINIIELPKGAIVMEINPDPEITSAETAIKKLEKEGHQVSDYAKDMLTKVNWEKKLHDSYEIVSISVSELGRNTQLQYTYAEIKAKAKKFGLDLVPSNLAPSIRLNYPKSGKLANIAMEATYNGGYLNLLRCNTDGSNSLLDDNHFYGSDDRWSSHSRFFFVRK